MMDGKNSTGRRISLLNDHDDLPRLPSFVPSLHSRTSSFASTPSLCPETPQLVRSGSTDSVTMQTPSPITPNFTFDNMTGPQQPTSPVYATTPYFTQPIKDPLSSYPPPLPQHNGPLPYPAPIAAHHQQPPPPPPQPSQNPYFRPPTAERQPMPPANPKSKKNSYPCPLAKQFNCNDHFTTSGHAARHAKKHTGKKDAFCPVCNKAFTRKDNMEQHKRTHTNGRNATKSTADDSRVKKTKLPAKKPRPAPLQASPLPAVDPSLPISPASSFGIAPAVQPPISQAYSPTDYIHASQYPDPTQFSHHPTAYATDDKPAYPLYALDALAIAASGEKRKYEG